MVDAELCKPVVEDVCCDQGDGSYATVPSTECAEDAVVDAAECAAKVCCKTEDGVLWVAEDACPEESVQPDALCERPLCCKIMDGPDVGNALVTTWTECIDQGGSVVYDGYCEQTVCCEDEDTGPALVPFSECTFLQVTETEACNPVQEPACCKIMTGAGAGNAVMATPTECADQGGAFVSDDYCAQEVCCETSDGPALMPYVECTFLQLTETSACDPPEEPGCCKDMENPGLGDAFIATPEDCFAQGGSPIFQEYCDQEVCCDMGEGPEYMPYAECTFLDMVATYTGTSEDPCAPPEEDECCKISFGVDTGNVVMATATECTELGGIVTVQDYCDQDVCCETADGMAFVPFLECPFSNVNADNACTPPEEEGCCQIVFGPDTGNVIIATPTECALAYGIPNTDEFCQQMMCCQTAEGPVMLPFLECPFADVVTTDQCTPEEDGCCKISGGPDTGNVLMATPSECEALQGIMTEQSYCDQTMCCDTDEGPMSVPFLECAFADVINPGECLPEAQVCCQGTAWPTYVDASDCEEALVLEDAECDITLCCANEGGAFFEGTPSECFAEGGSVVDESVCNPPDEPVCCDLGGGTLYILDSECSAQGGTTTAPSECVVCCEYPGGGVGQDPAAMCIAGLGIIVDDAQCETPEVSVCCESEAGTSYVTTSVCEEVGGAEVDVSACYVCCKNPFDNGPEFALEEDCDQLEPDDSSCDPPVCCESEAGTSYVATSECAAQSGSEVDVAACQVCCEDPFGTGPAYALENQCDAVVDDAVCDPPVCCEAEGSSSYVQTSVCEEVGGAEVDVSACYVCCKNPFNNGPEFALEQDCDQLEPDDSSCDPPVCCESAAGTSYIATSECVSQSGSEVDVAACQVCCANPFGAGPDYALESQCDEVAEASLCDPAICCDVAGETSYIATSECTAQGGVSAAAAQCTVCCQYPGGGTGEDPAEFCLAGGGVIVDDAVCAPPETPICCQTEGQTSAALPSACAEQGGTEVDADECYLCCKNPYSNGPEFAPEADCEQPQPTTELCDSTVCCQSEAGAATMTTAECLVVSGEVVSPAVCAPPVDEMICCFLSTGNTYMLQSECDAEGSTTLPLSECRICCQYADESLSLEPVDACFAGGGEMVDEALCQPEPVDEPVCCEVDGETNYVLNSECTASEGAVVAASECPVCCQGKDGAFTETTAAACADSLGSVVDDAECAPPEDPMTCCEVDGETNYVLTSECTASEGAVVAASECPVCCQGKDGAFTETTAAACADSLGSVVDDAQCLPAEDPMICCDVGGETSYVATSECTDAGGAETGPINCQVCCQFPGGTDEVPAEFCLAGEGYFVDDALCDEAEETDKDK